MGLVVLVAIAALSLMPQPAGIASAAPIAQVATSLTPMPLPGTNLLRMGNTSSVIQSDTGTSVPLTANVLVASAANSFATTLGTAIAGITFIIIVGFVGRLLFAGYRRIWIQQPDLRVQTTLLNDKERPEDSALLVAIHDAFLRLRRSLSVAAGRFQFPDAQLQYFLDLIVDSTSGEKVMGELGAGLGQVNLKLSAGPVEVDNLGLIWRRLTGPREFAFIANSQSDATHNQRRKIVYILTSQGQVWYTHTDTMTMAPDGLKASLESEARRVAWVISRHNIKDADKLVRSDLPELKLIQGLQLVSDFFMDDLASIRPLEEARKCFVEAVEDDAWVFQASLLEVITLQLTQANPGETVKRMTCLRRKFKRDDNRRAIISYYLGQVRFYQYTQKGYRYAIKNFEKICRPIQWLWKIRPLWILCLRVEAIARQRLPPFWRRRASNYGLARYQLYCLYCLARCNIAMTLAHSIDPQYDSSKNQKLADDAFEIVGAVREELKSTSKLLGTAVPEVEWRLFNTVAMISIRLSRNLEQGLEAATQALKWAPYALGVKANLGSLYLKVAAEKSSANPSQTEDFVKAAAIFEYLEGVGWDPGFVKFRLGMIRRSQGRFHDARELLRQAGDHEIKDVEQEQIDAQIALADAKKQKLTLSEVV
jgi:hypothetical protein